MTKSVQLVRSPSSAPIITKPLTYVNRNAKIREATQKSKGKTQNHNQKLKTTQPMENQSRQLDLRNRCYRFSVDIIKFLAGLPEKRVYWAISDQLLRSATSIGANITEAKAASSKRDFLKFYEIALKSANETEYWLKLLQEFLIISDQNVGKLLDELNQISKILGASILTMKNKRKL